MPLFIFLSGLVSVTDISWSRIPSDIWKRFRVFLIPFVLFGSLYSLLYSGNFDFVFSNYKFGYWYLWVLFALYLINYPFVIMGGGKQRFVMQLVMIAILWWSANHYVNRVPQSISDILSLTLLVKFFPYYVMGNFIKRYSLHDRIFANPLIFVISIAIWMFGSYLTFPYSDYLVTTAAIIVIMNVCRKMDVANLQTLIGNRIKSGLNYIGQATLYIYLFHYFAIQPLRTTFFYALLPQYSNFGWDILLSIPIVTLAVLFSLGIKFILGQEPLIMKYIFNKK